jgi:hypothetical protein
VLGVLTGDKAPLQHCAVWEKMVCSKLVDFVFIRDGWNRCGCKAAMAREKDCSKHEGGASVEAKGVEKLKEKWRWRKE